MFSTVDNLRSFFKERVMRSRSALLLLLVLGAFLFCANVAEAQYETYFLYRGQTVAFPINPGETVTVIAFSDGKPCKFTWWDNWYYYIQFRPYTAMTAFYVSPYSCYWLRNAAVQGTPQSASWTIPSGWYYVFVIRNFTEGDWVYIRFR